jgi:hypothetical protein
MGYVKKILSSRKISNKPVFYTKSLRIDLAESFHLHYRNNRIEMSPDEFAKLSKSFFISWLEWNIMGRPKIRPPGNHLAFTGAEISEEIGGGYPSIRGDELTVELQYQADYIHLHYRGIRIEFTIDEFKDFAEVIGVSLKEIISDKNLEDYPKRIGINHKLQPEGRVSESKNIGNFWIGNTIIEQKNKNEKINRNSIIYDENQNKWINQLNFHDKLDENKLPNLLFSIPIFFYLILRPFIFLILFEKPKRNNTIEKLFISMIEEIFGKSVVQKFINYIKKIKDIFK